MSVEKILVICPPHATTAVGGPRGVLGDRIHQLCVLTALKKERAELIVFPKDGITETLFAHLDPEFCESVETMAGVDRVVACYAMPDEAHAETDDGLKALDAELQSLFGDKLIRPRQLDPVGARPLWREMLDYIGGALGQCFSDIELPLLPAQAMKGSAEGVLLVSPLSGGHKGLQAEDWWRELARLWAPGRVIVPLMPDEEEQGKALFEGVDNVAFTGAELKHVAALSASVSSVIGIDGGRFNVMAAAHTGPVIGIFGKWPASAWALPNVKAYDFSLTPEEAVAVLGRG